MLKSQISADERRADTRRKIQLGGLIVKAKLDEEPTNVLLGLLLEAADALNTEDAELTRRRWMRRGREAFATETESIDVQTARNL